MSVIQDYASSGWLQAFMGVQDPVIQQTRLFTKKHIDWLDSLSSLTTIREKSDSLDDALAGIWAYCDQQELLWALRQVPATNLEWVLPSNEDFTIQCKSAPTIETPQQLGAALGIRDWQTSVIMRILRSDFATWQQRVSRSGSSFSMATSTSNMMEVDCTASWTANRWVDGQWKILIEGQTLMNYEVEEAIQVVRPELESALTQAFETMRSADKRLVVSNKSPAMASSVPSWISPEDRLLPLHSAVFSGEAGSGFSGSFAMVWSAVWPVLYGRRKKLQRGHCEMKIVRSQLDQAFEMESKLTTWMFVFGELMCQTYLSDGLGICAKYQ